MSAEDTKEGITIPEERKKKLLEMIDAGIDPVKAQAELETKEKKDPLEAILAISDEDKKDTKKLSEKIDELTTYIKKREVDGQRTTLLEEIKSHDKELFEEEKDNHSLNELQAIIKTLRKTKPKSTKREVGATSSDKKQEPEKTQWDHLKKEFVAG